MRTTTLVLAIGLACAGAVRADETGDAAEARKAIDAANAKFSAAVMRQDVTALAGFYTDDCIVLPPLQPMMRGPKGAEIVWRSAFKGGLRTLALTTVDVERSGDVAIETGRFTTTAEAGGKAPNQARGKYVVVWKRQGNGAWKLHRDIWNATVAEK